MNNTEIKYRNSLSQVQRDRDPDEEDKFYEINERPVDDISIEFFYKPHTITLLALSIAAVVYKAFVR